MKTLPAAQLEIMLVIWENGESLSRKQIQELLTAKNWQTATINTLLHRLVESGFLKYTHKGREYIYYAAISKNEYQAEMSHDIVNTLYNNSLSNFVVTFVNSGNLSNDDIDELQNLLNDLKNRED